MVKRSESWSAAPGLRSKRPKTTKPLQPTIHAEQGSELWHAITFQYLPWTLIQLGAKPRASTNAGRILTDAQLPWHSFTVAGFKAFKSCLTNPITSGKTYYLLGTYFPFLVVTPKYGPLTWRAPTQMVPYRCFLLCVLDPLSPTYDLAYPVDCFEDDECIVVGEASLTTANQSSSQHSSPRRTLARLAYSDADDADQDPDYLEALKRSMTDTGAVLPDTGPVAGPSGSRPSRALGCFTHPNLSPGINESFTHPNLSPGINETRTAAFAPEGNVPALQWRTNGGIASACAALQVNFRNRPEEGNHTLSNVFGC
ncbi:hypothetical protein B0H10DRAFT_1949536 [Mycena sp. CBHHK59/15]|nr:hypothetical protein B0H10DRAFT_1949536 [Mycena sp. CBHHK59/15]